VLFIHDKLPLRTSKFHPHLGSPLCPSCRHDYEDVWHFFECQNLERRRLFTQLKQSLNDTTVKYSLHPAILMAFWMGLVAIRTDTPYPEIQADLPPILCHAVQAQSRLGWDQLYHGRVSHLWEQAIVQLNPNLTVTGQSIITKMIKSVWIYFLAVWKLRNQHLHNDAGQLSLPNYQQAVKVMYETRNQLPLDVQESIFHQPLEKMLEQPQAMLRTWIERSQRYIQQQLKAAQK